MTIEQIATDVVALQDTVHSLSQRIDRQQAPHILAHEDTQFDMRAPPSPSSMAQIAPQPISQGTPFVIQRHTEVIPPYAIIPIQTTSASNDRIQRVEQMLRQLRVAEGMDVWDVHVLI